MPCDQIRLQQVNFANGNIAVLKAALEAAGYTVTHDAERGALYFRDPKTYRTGNFANGKFTVQEGIDVDAIKVEYSQEAISRAKVKFGWNVSKKIGQNKGVLSKRTYGN